MASAGPTEAARLVAIAGGEIIGATRLQKIGCLVELAGANIGFDYTYHLYGPYSEQLDLAISDASALGLADLQQRRATWGGRYCVYRTSTELGDVPSPITALAKMAASANSVELELAVTALFLKSNGSVDPWADVASRKKAKATEDRLANARVLYNDFRKIEDLPRALPAI